MSITIRRAFRGMNDELELGMSVGAGGNVELANATVVARDLVSLEVTVCDDEGPIVRIVANSAQGPLWEGTLGGLASIVRRVKLYDDVARELRTSDTEAALAEIIAKSRDREGT